VETEPVKELSRAERRAQEKAEKARQKAEREAERIAKMKAEAERKEQERLAKLAIEEAASTTTKTIIEETKPAPIPSTQTEQEIEAVRAEAERRSQELARRLEAEKSNKATQKPVTTPTVTSKPKVITPTPSPDPSVAELKAQLEAERIAREAAERELKSISQPAPAIIQEGSSDELEMIKREKAALEAELAKERAARKAAEVNTSPTPIITQQSAKDDTTPQAAIDANPDGARSAEEILQDIQAQKDRLKQRYQDRIKKGDKKAERDNPLYEEDGDW